MNTKEYVEYLLKNYLKLKKDLEFLKYELNYFKGMTEEEAIDGLTFKKGEGEAIKSSSISDKTGKTALIFREYMKKIDAQTIESLKLDVYALEYELNWIEYCIERINEKYGNVLRDLYMTDKTWEDVCWEYQVCSQTLGNYRRRGLGEIIWLFEKYKRGVNALKIGGKLKK